MTWFIDAHEDLAWNMAVYQRDYSRSAYQTRQLEAETAIPAQNGDTMLGWPEYNQAQVRLVFGTLFAGPAKPGSKEVTKAQTYRTPAEANHLYWNQLGLYHKLCDEKPQAFRLIGTSQELQTHLQEWETPTAEPRDKPVGLGLPLHGRRRG